MIVSLNEIETTILKAARGAGMEWGLAEEAAQSARFLARLGLPFEAPFLDLFSSRAWNSRPLVEGASLEPGQGDAWLCPIRAGAYLSDVGIAGEVKLKRVMAPILLLPFAARANPKSDMTWKGVRLRLGAVGVAVIAGEPCALAASKADKVRLSPIADDRVEGSLRPVEAEGARVDDTSWAKLQGFEALTYVPASAKSRASGAGAGEIDND